MLGYLRGSLDVSLARLRITTMMKPSRESQPEFCKILQSRPKLWQQADLQSWHVLKSGVFRATYVSLGEIV